MTLKIMVSKESVRISKSIPLRVSVWDSESKGPNFQHATSRCNSKITWNLNIGIPHFIILTVWTRRAALERGNGTASNLGERSDKKNFWWIREKPGNLKLLP